MLRSSRGMTAERKWVINGCSGLTEASGKLATDKLISKIVSLEEAVNIFPEIHEHPDDYLKVIIDPQL